MPTPRDGNRKVADLHIVTNLKSAEISNESLISTYVEYQSQPSRSRPWRAETIRVRSQQLRTFAAALAPTHLLDVTEDQLLDWYESLRGSPETIGAYASAVRGICQWMCIMARPRLRHDNPAMALERPHVPPAPPRPMLDRYYDLALACSVSDPEMYLWLGLMGCSGLRCCEVAWMQVPDVERLEEGGLLHIVGKGGKRRTVPVGAMLLLTLSPFLRGRGSVFTRPTDGRPYTSQRVSQRVNRFLKELGVPAPQTAHSLRHRFGTDYHSLDADLYRQATLMGHASVDTTKRYTEVSPVEAARYIEQLTARRLRPDLRGRRAA